MSFLDYFKENIYEKLKTPNGNNPIRDRSESMLKIFELLEQKEEVYILESGYQLVYVMP